MAVNKNFVVKNGLEVNDDLILANAVDSMVGIGTSVPYYELHVQGGIGATSLWVAGVSTFTSDVSVTGVTTLASAGGITTVGGDLFVGGDLSVLGDVTYDEVVGRNLNITGVGTILNVVVGSGLSVTGISTLTGPVGLETGLTVAGVTTLASAGGITTTGGDLYVGGDLFVLDDITYDEVRGRNLSISGVGTITRLNTTNINNTGVSTITRLNTTDVVSVAGTITTGTVTQLTNTDFVSTSSTITSIVGTSATITRLNTTDIVSTSSTITTGTVTRLTSTNVNVSGMSTFASGLYVSGGELTVGAAFTVSQAGVITATKFVGEVDVTGGNFSGVGTFSTLHVGTSGTVLAAVDSATISLGSGANPVTATLNGGSIPSIGLAIALGG